MEIKTIVIRLDNAGEFDERVNAALKEGWQLVKREVLQPAAQSPERYTYIMLYAELVKLPETELQADPVTWQEGVEALRSTCRDAVSCDRASCPMYDWCEAAITAKADPPNAWPAPEGSYE